MADHLASTRLAELWVYPVKACRGIGVDQAMLGPLGLAHDRRWMIVRASDGVFLSQRGHPRLATIRPSLRSDRLVLELPGAALLELPLDDRGTRRRVAIWGDVVDAVEPDPAASRAVSRWLGEEVALVRFADATVRLCDADHAPRGSRTAFADGYPLLVTSRASLDELNQRIVGKGGSKLTMSRFRPNIVLDGLAAGAEDRARSVELGEPGSSRAALFLVKRCERCAVTTVDQDSGAPTGKEPLRTLASYRTDKAGGGVWFGQNAVPFLPDGPVVLEVGQTCRLQAREGGA